MWLARICRFGVARSRDGDTCHISARELTDPAHTIRTTGRFRRTPEIVATLSARRAGRFVSNGFAGGAERRGACFSAEPSGAELSRYERPRYEADAADRAPSSNDKASRVRTHSPSRSENRCELRVRAGQTHNPASLPPPTTGLGIHSMLAGNCDNTPDTSEVATRERPDEHDAGRWDRDRTAAETCSTLLRAAQLVRALSADQLAEHSLNDARLTAMSTLDQLARRAADCSQAELAAELLQSESNVCTLVERMRQDGLLYRLRSKQDRRKRLLKLTDAGRAVLEAASRAFEQRTSKLLEQMAPPERRRLDELLCGLVEHLDRLAQRGNSLRAPNEMLQAEYETQRQPVSGPHFQSACQAGVRGSWNQQDETTANRKPHQAGMRTDGTTDSH